MNGSGVIYKQWVMRIIIINVIIFFIQGLTSYYLVQYSYTFNNEVVRSGAPAMTFYFGLTPSLVLTKGFVWQFFTYMFLHGGFFHIFLNMYALLIFGMPIEQFWGSKKFLFYYLFTGTGAGITIFILNMIIGGGASHVPTIGASGAVFGLLLAFGILYPNVQILLFFIIPMKAKYLVIMYGAIELYSLISTGGQGNISHVGHLGGLFFGLVFFLFTRKRGVSFKSKLASARFHKEMKTAVMPQKATEKNNIEFLKNLLEKIKTSGPHTVSDDEIQRLKYIEIMTDDSDDLCDDRDFQRDDEYCMSCNNVEACFIREIKKHLS